MAEPLAATRARSAIEARARAGLASLSAGIAVVLHLLRSQRRVVSLAIYGMLTAVGYMLAFSIHFDDLHMRQEYAATVTGSLPLLIIIRMVVGHACGLSANRWRFVGMDEIRRLMIAMAVGTLVFWPLVWVSSLYPAVPTRVLLLEPVFTLLLTAGLWTAYRSGFEIFRRRGTAPGRLRNVLVVGAGNAGETLVRQMIRHPTGYRPVGFVDDDPLRQGTSIHGLKVLGDTTELAELARNTHADEILIAIPSAGPADLRRVVERCEPTGLPYRVLPGIAAVLNGEVSLSQLREVRIEDLLGRDPVELELPELARDLAGEAVLITGAAGSIGSELARQAARHDPERLVLLDQSETGLFYLEMELRELAPGLELTPVVADVVDAASVERVYDLYQPSRVFHAAAYKHVPMMEANGREALRNNVIGTWRVAAAAGRHRVEKFVLVSTDKAVRPANMMGATKRMAELVVLELQALFPQTTYGAVRFGNVLGSAGSVIPVFKRQLAEGKPLTVTHPDVTRYFMTIPEAAQLVLQASVLPELRGRIAMLEMGEPVRIVDLARTLVRLSGRGRGDRSIVFTGLRPGEKLHEELVAPGEETKPTIIPKVQVLRPDEDCCRGVLARMPEWDRMLALWQTDPVIRDLHRFVPDLEERNGAPANGGREHEPVPAGRSSAPGAGRIAARGPGRPIRAEAHSG